MEKRESWKSRIGFIFAALGSAVGLGSIWRFPYVVGENGGALFILLYVFFLLAIGFPILIAEILVGRTTKQNPQTAFYILGKKPFWKRSGKLTIITGFIVSTFYAVIAGFALGYLFEAFQGNLSKIGQTSEALNYFTHLTGSYRWSIGAHFSFLFLCYIVLSSGVRKGIELCSKILMPLLSVILLFLVIHGWFLPGRDASLKFLFSPDFSQLSAKMVLVALGQAFFTLSLGQGTMVTYGSYLSKKEDIARSCLPVVLLNTLIALLMGIAVFSVVFTVKMPPQSGSALIFETLPIVFSKIPFGTLLSILFFVLIAIAAITSEISALEPVIAYFIDEKKWTRKKAATVSLIAAFLFGLPLTLSYSLFKNVLIWDMNLFDLVSNFSVNFLIPIGGLLAALLVGWRWGMDKAFESLHVTHMSKDQKHFLNRYFFYTIKYLAPLAIAIILIKSFF
ncbi:MAG TPA: sodium-dependent transporter [Chlamydiales bacterium]|mgnify:CR=1 FL=1|nr:sodium-dependent transporter [Chlamydiales bacterium]